LELEFAKVAPDAEQIVEEIDDESEEFDDYDEYDEYDDFTPQRTSGGGSSKKQSPYTSKHVRVQEANMSRASTRTQCSKAQSQAKTWSKGK
jgi:hypothetical protein